MHGTVAGNEEKSFFLPTVPNQSGASRPWFCGGEARFDGVADCGSRAILERSSWLLALLPFLSRDPPGEFGLVDCLPGGNVLAEVIDLGRDPRMCILNLEELDRPCRGVRVSHPEAVLRSK